MDENKINETEIKKDVNYNKTNVNSISLNEEINLLLEKVQTTELKIQENYELFLRERAEVENIKKRTYKEILNVEKYSLKKILNDLLTILDSLENCFKIDDNNTNGIKLIYKMLLDILEKYGVKKIIVDEKSVLDPLKHEVVSTIENDTEISDKIIEVLQNGYTLHEHILRYTKVSVYKNK
ncbi:MAG TPA: nucleotide exchange factor GrpE [Candidatus Azoamicus sp. OHIO1]